MLQGLNATTEGTGSCHKERRLLPKPNHKKTLSGFGLGLPILPDRFLHSEVTPDRTPPATKGGEEEGEEGGKEGRQANQGSFELTLMSMFRFPSTICAPLKRLALSATT